MNELEQHRQFAAHYIRDGRALALQRRLIVVAGAGTMGSFVDAHLAHAGADVLAIDNDRLETPNLLRHYLRDRLLVGQHKATALATKLQAEVPELQRIRGLVADLERLTWDEYRSLVRGASLVIGCTGRDHIDRVLDTVARERGIPFLAPSLWGGTHPVLGDLLINAWNVPNRGSACFSCLRPPRESAAAPAEAQPGLEAEIQRVASLTAEVAIALLASESAQHGPLLQQLGRGANYILLQRWPPVPRIVVTRPRRDCRVCTPRPAPVRPGAQSLAPREAAIGLALASATLWHQAIPGLDAGATLALIAAAGLWWRNRLPSFTEVSARVRSVFGVDP